MKIEIPGYEVLDLKYLVLDYNGTIALDGKIPDSIRRRLQELSEEFEIIVLTADTHGTAEQNCRRLPVSIQTFPRESAMLEKMKVVTGLGTERCIAIGNGRNDMMMLRAAQLSIAVMDAEGVSGSLMKEAEICVRSMEEALDLLRFPSRIIATLRG